ncbi:MAG: GSCFA domain-containing protein, partial [Bacteroidota bacterium]
MKFRTKIPIEPQQHHQINYDSKMVLLGSCFSQNIGAKFEYYKFRNIINPLGIIFNPVAIERNITRAVNSELYAPEDLIEYNDLWLSLDAHSETSSDHKDDVLNTLNQAVEVTHSALFNASHIIITLGTAWVYRHIATDTIVANCHKIPQRQFLKELLSVDNIINALQGIVALVKDVNPKVSILFTVSPVRHLKDGFVENTRSKSHLLAAVQEVVDPRKQLFYFPSYEIMMDDLRGYRFYDSDMIHPNTLAIDYIWEHFKLAWISSSFSDVMSQIDSIQRRLEHQPF